MVCAHINAVFDDYAENYTQEELLRRIEAFIFNLERLFGAPPGSLGRIRELF
jgi:hypothetical protein